MNEFGTSAELPHGGPVDVDEAGRPVEGAAAPAAIAPLEAPEAAAAIEGSSAPAAAPAAANDLDELDDEEPDELDEPRPVSASTATAESDAGDELRRRKK